MGPTRFFPSELLRRLHRIAVDSPNLHASAGNLPAYRGGLLRRVRNVAHYRRLTRRQTTSASFCSALPDFADVFMCCTIMQMTTFLSASFPRRGIRDPAGMHSEEQWGSTTYRPEGLLPPAGRPPPKSAGHLPQEARAENNQLCT